MKEEGSLDEKFIHSKFFTTKNEKGLFSPHPTPQPLNPLSNEKEEGRGRKESLKPNTIFALLREPLDSGKFNF